MNLSLRKYFILLFVGAMFFTDCKKKEVEGPQGPKGDPGAPGNGGNSDISSWTVFPISSAEWVTDSAAVAMTATVNTSLLTKEVIETGSVKVYIDIDGKWWELPYLEGDEVTQFGFAEGILKMKFTDMHGAFPERPATSYYRLVVLKKL